VSVSVNSAQTLRASFKGRSYADSSSRLSLPASLLEPIPNLEYWQYADRADIFAACVTSRISFRISFYWATMVTEHC
jgi:hypothetical protein